MSDEGRKSQLGKSGIENLRENGSSKKLGGSKNMFKYEPRQSVTGEHPDFAADEFD